MANGSNGSEERVTKQMLEYPISSLAKLIGSKWYLPLEKLSEKSGAPITAIIRVLKGKPIRADNERKLREFLENYKGESVCTKQD